MMRPKKATRKASSKYANAKLATECVMRLADRLGASEEVMRGLHGDADALPLLMLGIQLDQALQRIEHLEALVQTRRKQRASRTDLDRSRLNRRNAEIVWCARNLLLAGAPPRGIAEKIRRELRSELSAKQIGRILEEWVEVLSSKT
jgi:hypothetical protein